jgi:PAS domain S-box-containing protein
MPRRDPSADWLSGGGGMGERIRSFDWSETPLGPVDGWSQGLRSATSSCLGSRFPIVIYWGPEFVTLYNDAYAPILAGKHPLALGRPCREVWGEIWDVIAPMLHNVVATGEATWSDNQLLVLERHGSPEECYFSFSFSPVRSEDHVGGVFTAVIEHTQRIVGERRVIALQELGARATKAKTAEGACAIAGETLARHPKDIPFALLYLMEADGKRLQLVGSAGVGEDDRISPPVIDLDVGPNDARPWPVAEALRTDAIQIVEDVAGRFGCAVPPGPWSHPPRDAVLAPIRSNIAGKPAGILVAGISAHLSLDDLYRSFYELVASQIANAIANAVAYEAKRRRAEALAEIDRAKTVFFSNVSHEFRTPLTLMLGPLEDLKGELGRSASPASVRQYQQIDLVHRNGLRLLKFSARELLAIVASNLKLARLRREAHAALRESEERFRHMADNAPVMVWVTGPDAACSYHSKSWYDFTGQTPETGLGFGWIDAVHPDDRLCVHDAFLAASARQEAFRLEYRLVAGMANMDGRSTRPGLASTRRANSSAVSARSSTSPTASRRKKANAFCSRSSITA